MLKPLLPITYKSHLHLTTVLGVLSVTFFCGLLAASFVPPTKVAAESSAAASYCKGQGLTPGGRNGPDYSACTDGYDGKYNGQSLASSCDKWGPQNQPEQGSTGSICKMSWSTATVKGGKPAPKPKPPTKPSKEAVTQCSKPPKGSASTIAACEIGYEGAKAGKDKSSLCAPLGVGSKSLGSQADCEAGFDLASSSPGTGGLGSSPDPAQCAAYHDANPGKPLPLGCQSNAGASCDKENCDIIQKYVNPALNILSVIFGLIAALSLIMGGIQYTASAGDSQKVQNAKQRISLTVIAFMAYAFLYTFLQFLIPGGIFHGP